MKSSANARFWQAFAALPPEIQRLARKNFRLWKENPRHGSLHFKKVGPVWSVRVGDDFRALAQLRDGTFFWFWIGSHAEYDRLAKQR
jgi:hypothetical protein